MHRISKQRARRKASLKLLEAVLRDVEAERSGELWQRPQTYDLNDLHSPFPAILKEH